MNGSCNEVGIGQASSRERVRAARLPCRSVSDHVSVPAAWENARCTFRLSRHSCGTANPQRLKPWTPGESRLPKNIQADKPYRGGNSVYLSVTQTAKGYSDHRWATYKQISDIGGQVRKGEKATHVLFYKFDDEKKKAQEQPGTPTTEGQAEKEQTRPPMVRCYAVFNVEQGRRVDAGTPG